MGNATTTRGIILKALAALKERHTQRRIAALLASITVGAWPALASAITPERVRITGAQDDAPLTGFLYRPETKTPSPAIVFLHGCSGLGRLHSETNTYRAWAEQLVGDGYAVLSVDSAGSRGFGATCGPGAPRKTMYRYRPGDAYAALAFLQSRAFIKSNRIGLIGWSQGGGIVLLTISEHSIGRPHPPPRHDFKAAVAFYPSACNDRLQSRPFTTVAPGTWNTATPLLVLQGGADNWTPKARCLKFIQDAAKRGAPVRIKIYSNALHGFDAPSLKRRILWKYTAPDGTAPIIGTSRAARADALRRVSGYFRDQMNR